MTTDLAPTIWARGIASRRTGPAVLRRIPGIWSLERKMIAHQVDRARSARGSEVPRGLWPERSGPRPGDRTDLGTPSPDETNVESTLDEGRACNLVSLQSSPNARGDRRSSRSDPQRIQLAVGTANLCRRSPTIVAFGLSEPMTLASADLTLGLSVFFQPS